MIGIITLIVLLLGEVVFLFWAAKTKQSHQKENSYVRIAEFVILITLLITGVFEWGFRYFIILAILGFQTVISVISLSKKLEKPYRLSKSILGFVLLAVIYGFGLLPAIIFPQYTQPITTGGYEIETAKYTWADENRIESFSNTGENRALTVEFWYPKNIDGKFPLVVFSHGAFGFSGSNLSTFTELASNGYVVASIGHTYHALYTMDTSGKLTTVNADFFNGVNAVNEYDDPEQDYYGTREWMNLRVADEHFVLDTISQIVNSDVKDDVFSLIDIDHIGVFGHSLGGASFAQVGRERQDIDAVINLDGTMLGEQIDFANGKAILNNTPYPIPLLNIYAENHYQTAMELAGYEYENFNASRNAVCAYEIVFKDAGHLNFTDLPLFSPTFAKILGIGEIDARYCIEKTNNLVLEFFDCYLKDGETPMFEKEY